jgi:hypothetical protein
MWQDDEASVGLASKCGNRAPVAPLSRTSTGVTATPSDGAIRKSTSVMDRERKSIQVGVMDIMRAITISLTLASLLLVGLLSPSVAQPTAILGRKEDVMVWVLAFEISLALIIGFVVLRSQSASLVGRRKIRSDAATASTWSILAAANHPQWPVGQGSCAQPPYGKGMLNFGEPTSSSSQPLLSLYWLIQNPN